MTSTSDVSVVVSAYSSERWDDLSRAVASLRRQTVAPKEIIVVIDHNPDLFRQAVERLDTGTGTGTDTVMVVENAGPQGLSGARNQGVRAASGSIVAFLDDDAAAEPDWIERLLAPYRDPHVVAVGGSIIPEWDTSPPDWFPAEFNWVVGCTYRGLPEAAAPIRNLIGANMSFRRAVFDEVGGFRTGFGRIGTRPLGCEETEFCIRLRQRLPTARIIYEPSARVSHRVPVTRASWRYFRARCWSEGISKAQVSRTVGAGDGLESERAYLLRTLPSGVAHSIGDTLLRREVSGLSRAAALVAGLSFTALGYMTKVLSTRVRRDPILASGFATK